MSRSEEEEINISGDLDSGLTSSSDSKMSLNLQLTNPMAREWIHTRRRNIRAWTVFLNASWFQTPQSATQLGQRILRNLEHFQSNYLFVFMALMIYCILTSPLLLVALVAALGGSYIVSLRDPEQPLKILGYEITPGHQYLAVLLLAIPLFLLAGASSAFFWVLGASFFVIMLHASFFAHEKLPPPEDKFTLETV
jgi:hypothetical protein